MGKEEMADGFYILNSDQVKNDLFFGYLQPFGQKIDQSELIIGQIHSVILFQVEKFIVKYSLVIISIFLGDLCYCLWHVLEYCVSICFPFGGQCKQFRFQFKAICWSISSSKEKQSEIENWDGARCRFSNPNEANSVEKVKENWFVLKNRPKSIADAISSWNCFEKYEQEIGADKKDNTIQMNCLQYSMNLLWFDSFKIK